MPNRKRYVVRSIVNGQTVTEGFTKPGIDSLKNLGMLRFSGSSRDNNGTVYYYVPARQG
jgi:hypothetical protein